MERKFHGSENSLCGLFAPGNESAEERKGLESILILTNNSPPRGVSREWGSKSCKNISQLMITATPKT